MALAACAPLGLVHVAVEPTEQRHKRGAQRAGRDRGGRTGERVHTDEPNAWRGGTRGEEVGYDLLELRLHVRAGDVVVRRRCDGRRVVRTGGRAHVRVQEAEELRELALHAARRECVRRSRRRIHANARGTGAAHRPGRKVVDQLVDGGLHVARADEPVRRVVDRGRRMAPGDGGEVVAQLGVGLVERGLHGRGERLEDAPRPGGHGHRGALREDERLPARGVEIGDQDLRLPRASPHVAEQQLVGLERGLRRDADGPLGRLPHHELERLVSPEEHLLGVAVRARVGELALETQEDAQPPLIADRGDIGRDAHEVHGTVHGLARAEEHALAEVVVRPPWRGEVHGQVGHRRVRRRDGTGDDAVDVQVGGEVPVRLLEQREREVELGLGDALAEVEVDAIGHVLASERPRGPPGRQSRRARALGTGRQCRSVVSPSSLRPSSQWLGSTGGSGSTRSTKWVCAGFRYSTMARSWRRSRSVRIRATSTLKA